MKSLGIRSEDKNRWEKRVPLVPRDIVELRQSLSTPMYVESPSIRIFPDHDYAEAGCTISRDMTAADIVIGIKEIPEQKIMDHKVYLFFSHTIKGQKPNMPLLQKVLDSGSTLLDYERIIDEHNRRLIFFGNYAGTAGAIDILWLTGREWQRLGISSPLDQVKQAFDYQNVAAAKADIARIGQIIKEKGWPAEFAPLVIGIWGYGNVSQGAQDIFTLFPHHYISPAQLIDFRKSGQWSNNVLYLCVFREEDMVRHHQGKPFELHHYYTHPEEFVPVTETSLASLNILVNAIFWNKQYPHFLSRDNAASLWKQLPEPRFFAIADLSCDVAGGVEITVKCTDSGQPAFKYDPMTATASDDLADQGFLVLAVDNLPGELAYDASVFFSHLLKPFIPSLVQADYSKPLAASGLSGPLQRAVIVYNGELTPDYHYLQKYL